MKRRICSYDMAVVPEQAFVLTDAGGEMFLCGARCLALWSIQHLTHPHARAEQLNAEWTMAPPTGEKRRFPNLHELTRWAAANLLSPGTGEWSTLGEVIKGNQPSNDA